MKWKEIVLAVAIIIAIAALVYVNFLPKEKAYTYSVREEGVLFASDLAPPGELLQFNAQHSTFIVSHEFREGTENLDDVTNALTAFQAVLTAADKKVVTVLRETDAEGNLLGCQTNKGDRKEVFEVSAEECREILREKGVLVNIFSPDPSLKQPTVVLHREKIDVFPSSENNSSLYLLILKSMFRNTQEVLDAINAMVAVR